MKNTSNTQPTGIKKLVDYIRRLEAGEQIKEINLVACIIGAEGAKALAGALRNNNSVTDPNLLASQIGDEGSKSSC